MRCRSCHGMMAGGKSRTVLDDSGALAITAWWCRSCDEVIEEVRTRPRYGDIKARRVRYAVRPWDTASVAPDGFVV